jgi:hypothetical protein
MRVLDTNILVYAHRKEAPFHSKALHLLKETAEGQAPWAIPWPCIYEFLRIVTHPRVFHPPTPIEEARAVVRHLVESPSLRLLSETSRHHEILGQVLRENPVSGNLVHDAHIAALLREHGIDEILTADEDFRRFQDLRARNPFRE